MAKLPEAYNPQDHEPEEDLYAPIPPGTYQVEVTGSEIKETKAGDAMPQFEFTIIGEKQTGRKLWANFNLYHSTSEQARRISNGEFSAMCRALGCSTSVADTEELHGKVCKVRVATRRYQYNGEERTSDDIKAYIATEGAGEPWAPKAASPAKPAPAASPESNTKDAPATDNRPPAAPWMT